METKPRLNKTKSTAMKKKLRIKKYRCSCQCVWSFLTSSKIRNQTQHNGREEPSEKEPSEKEPGKAESFDKADVNTSFLKKKKTHITRLPRIGCEIPFLVTLFTNLSESGAVYMNEREIMNAVNVTAKVKKDLDEGKQWTGNIEITENLKLKLHKAGLVLCYKK